MLQDINWFTKPESLFRTALWLLGPFFGWFIGRAILRRYEAWEAARSESKARAQLTILYSALDNPPTLLESLAYIVCFLPIPIWMAALGITLHFAPRPPRWFFPFAPPFSPETARRILEASIFVPSFLLYLVFGVLTAHGVRTLYHLRHGQVWYRVNYKAGIRKRIDKLLKKFPQLRKDQPST
jgi:hypothetical protein